MKAIITVDIPEHQIGQEVSVYFKDTMCVKSVCTPLTESDDCVSREEAIKAIENVLAEYVIYFFFRKEEEIPLKCTRALMSLSSVQPNREKHDEEIIKETVESVWGKPPYNEVLDSIKADVEQYQADCDLSCSDDANCRTCDRITFDSIYRIIDKYRGKKNDK